MCRPGKRYTAPVVMTRFRMSSAVVISTIPLTVHYIQSSPQTATEIFFQPCPCTQPDTGKFISQQRSQMVCTESPHTVSTENYPVAVNGKLSTGAFYYRSDILDNSVAVPAFSIDRRQSCRSNSNKRYIGNVRLKYTVFFIYIKVIRLFRR